MTVRRPQDRQLCLGCVNCHPHEHTHTTTATGPSRVDVAFTAARRTPVSRGAITAGPILPSADAV